MKIKKNRSYEEEYAVIEGISHYLLHYPSRPEQPLVLYLHGGPGQSEASFAYVVEEFAERNYNIVYYDQRGAGKTYLKNRKSKPDIQTLKEDLLAMVLYLKKRYRKEKIAILGHSWGSVLGSLFALEYPEHVLCYIGCGQVVSINENELLGLQKLTEAVEKAGNHKDLEIIRNLGEYPGNTFDMAAYRKMGQVRRLQGKYNLSIALDKSLVRIFIKSPVTRIKDLLPFMIGIMMSKKVMEELLRLNLREQGTDYQVPVYYVLGENDQQTPVELGKSYFEEILAPDKKLYMIPDAGHLTMIDNISEYRKAVCEIMERECC